MTPERWAYIKALWAGALLRGDTGDRRAYLDRASPSVRAEVESLLRRHGDRRGPLSAYDSLSGQCVGHYQVLEAVGRGGMGIVYKALDTVLGRTVVLKLLPPVLMAAETTRLRLYREARCLAALNHPNIVTIHEVCEENGLVFLVMEYVAGKPLSRLIPRRGLAMECFLRYATQIAQALACAHAEGVIHRDLKPSNILVTDEGIVKIIDFGLAKGRNLERPEGIEPVSQPGAVLGSVGYMSPEQLRGKEADSRSDVFSIGAVFYEMLTGIAPFKRETDADTEAAVLIEDPLVPIQRVPPAVLHLIQRCLEKDPNRRFKTARELATALSAASVHDDRGHRIVPLLTHRWHAFLPAVLCLVLASDSGPDRVIAPKHDNRDMRPANISSQNRAAANSGSFVDVAAQAAGTQSTLALYDRARRNQAKADAVCFQRTDDCDVAGALAALNLEIADLSLVLHVRPGHTASLWNRGLAYSGLCELQSRTEDFKDAAPSCGRAIADLEGCLAAGPLYPDLSASTPNPAHVLWNLGLTHLLWAKIPGNSELQVREFNKAIEYFDRLLAGGSRYEPFLAKRRDDLLRYRAMANESRALLSSRTGAR